MMRSRSLALSCLLALTLLAGCAQEPAAVPANDRAPGPSNGMVMTTTIVVTNTGATNLIGYRLLISRDGTVSYASGDGSGQATLPPALRDTLVHDIDAAKPLANLGAAPACAKSASFGSSTYIEIGGDRSPDISCPGNAKAQALNNDVAAIASYLHVRNVMRGGRRRLPVQNF